MTDRPYQLLPQLDDEQRHLLRQSIIANGVLEPVVFDEDGEILDGHHRVEIAEELDIDYPRRVVTDLDEAGKQRYALTTNIARRQLIPSVRGALVARLRTQGMSIRQIADATGIPRETVRRDVSGDPSGSPERITGADNKTYAAARPAPKTPEPVDAAVATPPAGSGSSDRPVDEATPASAPVEDPPATEQSPAAFAGGGAGADDKAEPAALSPAAQELADDIKRESERRAAVAGIRSVLLYLTSESISPDVLAKKYVIALGEFAAEDLEFAAKTMAALAALKEQ